MLDGDTSYRIVDHATPGRPTAPATVVDPGGLLVANHRVPQMIEALRAHVFFEPLEIGRRSGFLQDISVNYAGYTEREAEHGHETRDRLVLLVQIADLDRGIDQVQI